MAIVCGFAGLRIRESGLSFNPALPDQWRACRFRITYRDSRIQVEMTKTETTFTLLSGTEKGIRVYGKPYTLKHILRVERE
jgi:alpha,alpha-trehalose phosphorylase